MFKISYPVRRFVIGCILLMILVIGADALGDVLWTWNDQFQDIILSSRS
jgi:hypothetical protein